MIFTPTRNINLRTKKCLTAFCGELGDDIAKTYEILKRSTDTPLDLPAIQSFQSTHTNGRVRPEMFAMIRNALKMTDGTKFELVLSRRQSKLTNCSNNRNLQ